MLVQANLLDIFGRLIVSLSTTIWHYYYEFNYLLIANIKYIYNITKAVNLYIGFLYCVCIKHLCKSVDLHSY